MAYNAQFDLRGKRIQDTYTQVVQYDTASNTIFTGQGASLDNFTASVSLSSSFASKAAQADTATSASYAPQPVMASASYAAQADHATLAGGLDNSAYGLETNLENPFLYGDVSIDGLPTLRGLYLNQYQIVKTSQMSLLDMDYCAGLTASVQEQLDNMRTGSGVNTASYALNSGGGTTLVTASTYQITSSWANNARTASFFGGTSLTASSMLIGTVYNPTTAAFATTRHYSTASGEYSGSNLWQFQIYSYKTINGVKTYSQNYKLHTDSEVDSIAYEHFLIWTEVSGSDGYKILLYSDTAPNPIYNFDWSIDTTGSTSIIYQGGQVVLSPTTRGVQITASLIVNDAVVTPSAPAGNYATIDTSGSWVQQGVGSVTSSFLADTLMFRSASSNYSWSFYGADGALNILSYNGGEWAFGFTGEIYSKWGFVSYREGAGGFYDLYIPKNTAAIWDSVGRITSSLTTDTEIGYLSGATSNIQTQINNISSTSASWASQSFTLRNDTASIGIDGHAGFGKLAGSDIVEIKTNDDFASWIVGYGPGTGQFVASPDGVGGAYLQVNDAVTNHTAIMFVADNTASLHLDNSLNSNEVLLRSDGESYIFNQSNFGIGTFTPQSKLHVANGGVLSERGFSGSLSVSTITASCATIGQVWIDTYYVYGTASYADTASVARSASYSPIIVQGNGASTDQYIPFVVSSGSNDKLFVDNTNDLRYNPTNGLLTVTHISASCITGSSSPSGYVAFLGTASYAHNVDGRELVSLPYSSSAQSLAPIPKTGSMYFHTEGGVNLLYIYSGLAWTSCSLA